MRRAWPYIPLQFALFMTVVWMFSYGPMAFFFLFFFTLEGVCVVTCRYAYVLSTQEADC